MSDTAAYVINTVKNPRVDSIGGEWAVMGLARSGCAAPESYYENYFKAVEKYIGDREGVLHATKYTEYSRVILGLTAAGYDPRDIAGYDLTEPLGDYEKTVWQGINGPVFALLALDSLNYPIPENATAKTQATRDMYVAEILRRQIPDEGWNLTAGVNGTAGFSEKSDTDVTGMALQALAKYTDKPEVKKAVDEALAFLSKTQDNEGGFKSNFSNGSSSVESSAQVIVALCELGIPINDARFVKNGKSLVDNILSYKNTDGGFFHSRKGDGNNQMATEQAFYGLVAAQRSLENKNSLYRMSDAVKRGGAAAVGSAGSPEPEKPSAPVLPAAKGLAGIHPDVSVKSVVNPGKTFADVKNHANKTAVEVLAIHGIISGKSADAFEPDATMTRAEFASVVARGLGLPEKKSSPFTDISVGAWYSTPVATAYFYGIINGVSATAFNPDGTITRQEAAVMITRAARLCGLETELTVSGIRDELAIFDDYRAAASWAQPSLAFCFSEGILDETDFGLNIEPEKPVKRCEIAEMLYRMLERAELI